MFEHITPLVRKEQVTLFVGAGFSFSAGAPSCSDMISSIIEYMTDEEKKHIPKSKCHDLAYISDMFVKSRSGGRNQLIGIISELMRFKRKDLIVHQQLAHTPHFHNIITTNYDTLIEDSLNQKGDGCQVVRNDKDCTLIDKTIPTIYKIHGDLCDPDNIILTSADYEQYFDNRRNPNMWDVIKSHILQDNILFIGYSISDSNIIDIITRITDAVGDNRKSFFLIAPDFKRKDKQRLKELRVEYIDSTAKAFFAELEKSLCENIVKDAQKKKVSERTFQKFSNWHNLEPSLLLKSKENVFKGFQPIAGTSKETTFRFTTRVQSNSIEDFFDFEKRGQHYSDLPDYHSNSLAIKFSKEMLKNLDWYENGIKIFDLEDIRDLYIEPVNQTGQMTIEVPSRDFLELVEVTSCRLNKYTIQTTIDLDAFEFNLILSLPRKKNSFPTLKFNITPNHTYNNTDIAIKWASFLNDIFSGNDFYIKEITPLPFNIAASNIPVEKIINPYNKFVTYYKGVKKLELLNRSKFTKYYNYSEERYDILQAIIAYKTKEPVITYTPDGYDFSFVINDFQSQESKEFLESGGPYVLAYSNFPLSEITFNDVPFKIPYRNTVLKNCTIKSIVKNNDNTARIVVHNSEQKYISFYSDNPINSNANGTEIQVSPI